MRLTRIYQRWSPSQGAAGDLAALSRIYMTISCAPVTVSPVH